MADDQFTKRACEQIGINFELRLVGQAREGMDGAGVGIGVEEAILEANEDDEVDGIMVSLTRESSVVVVLELTSGLLPDLRRPPGPVPPVCRLAGEGR